ncbi:sulfur carrier protein ThiS [uncultured Oxalicibacterium sp.]|uniref:sulfur carrier protein ThiS n=1 Tax=uncultured Oxalicibacterium sp. TaxID=1168540 RepID=UPI0025D30145|nr:sulfur carrier protein ThiS [uncultured Oxalicibacterium sp.]
MIEIELNGAPHQIAHGSTVVDLIAALSLTGKALAVAINREVVSGNRWCDRVLEPADRVDIVRAIGGG